MTKKKSAWRPRVPPQREFNPFANTDGGTDSMLETPQLKDSSEDTAPLQGTRDLTDEDSLEDVVADADRASGSRGSAPVRKPDEKV